MYVDIFFAGFFFGKKLQKMALHPCNKCICITNVIELGIREIKQKVVKLKVT